MKGLLGDLSRDVAGVFGDNLVALVMGGSYGRGEGRVFSRMPVQGTGVWSGGEVPADDIDLLVLLNAPAYDSREFLRICRKYQDISGAELDVMGVLTSSQVRRLPPGWRAHQMAMWHKVLWGDPELAGRILACLRLDREGDDRDERLLSAAYALCADTLVMGLSALSVGISGSVTAGHFLRSRLGTARRMAFRVLVMASGCMPGGISADIARMRGASPGCPGMAAGLHDSILNDVSAVPEGGDPEWDAEAWARLMGHLLALASLLGNKEVARDDGRPLWKDRGDWKSLLALAGECMDGRGQLRMPRDSEWLPRLAAIAGNFREG